MLVDRQCLRKHILLVLIARTISSAQRIDNAQQAFFEESMAQIQREVEQR